MTSEANTEHTPDKPIAWLPRRLQILLTGVVLLVLSSTGLCVLAALKTMNFTPEWFSYWLLMLAGPFAGLTDPSDTSPWVAMGAINLLFILAHPIWPNRFTAALTLLAFASWLFWGLAVTFSGV